LKDVINNPNKCRKRKRVGSKKKKWSKDIWHGLLDQCNATELTRNSIKMQLLETAPLHTPAFLCFFPIYFLLFFMGRHYSRKKKRNICIENI